MNTQNTSVHQSQPVLQAGEPLRKAEAAVILLHGRGATAESILSLTDAFNQPKVHYRAPQAANNTWYPHSFLAPLEHNEPFLSSALQKVREVLDDVRKAGMPLEKIMLLGFSQGACLASEVAARYPGRYGALVGLSGGLIGRAQKVGETPYDKDFDYKGSLDGTPVFLGCSDVDPHIPAERVEQSAATFQKLGADVTKRIYPGMGHTVNADEIKAVRDLLSRLLTE